MTAKLAAYMRSSSIDRLRSMAEYAEDSLNPVSASVDWKRMDALRMMLRGEIARLTGGPNPECGYCSPFGHEPTCPEIDNQERRS